MNRVSFEDWVEARTSILQSPQNADKFTGLLLLALLMVSSVAGALILSIKI